MNRHRIRQIAEVNDTESSRTHYKEGCYIRSQTIKLESEAWKTNHQAIDVE